MTGQETALVQIATFCTDADVPYMVIGGMANIIWGEPRATLDIDVTVWVSNDQISDVIQQLGAAYRVQVPDPVQFVERTRVLPVETAEGVRIDVVFGLLSMEQAAIGRARAVLIQGTEVMFCSPEDLVLLKIISDREQDLKDASAVVRRRYDELDLTYLEPRIHALARDLEKPEIAERWNQWRQRD